MMCSLHAASQAWGGLFIIALLIGLVVIHAWGPLAFIMVGVLVQYILAERTHENY